jgi:hypothetical protein
VVHTYTLSYTGGISKKIAIQLGAGKIRKTLSKKITKRSRVGGMAQVLKCLPSKHEAWSSNQKQQNFQSMVKKIFRESMETYLPSMKT